MLLLNKCWNTGEIPEDWKKNQNTNSEPIYKKFELGKLLDIKPSQKRNKLIKQ